MAADVDPLTMPVAASLSKPVTAAEFENLLAPFAPFELHPGLAVGVSGGPDSVALTLLADAWSRARGGRILALIVDHGLRSASPAEAALVAGRLAARGIEARILPWRGVRPASGVQAAARAARHALLEAACREAGIPHLLLAHQREDQAETVFLRRKAGSGPDGLAAMAAVVERRHCRLLRPLLAVPRSRLIATLKAAGESWIEDPSNTDTEFARVRARNDLVGAGGEAVARLAEGARDAGMARERAEERAAKLLARTVSIHPAGFAWLDGAALVRARREDGLRALAALLRCLGGGAYPPQGAALNRLLATLAGGGTGRTLAGCRIGAPGRDGRHLVCRESGRTAPPVATARAGETVWDNRFVAFVADGPDQSLCLGRLGWEGWAQAVAARPELREEATRAIPVAARASLPALWEGERLVAAPHLGFVAPDQGFAPAVRIAFRPRNPLMPAPFRSALPEPLLMESAAKAKFAVV